MICRSMTQGSVKKLICGGEFIACNGVVDGLLIARGMVRCIGYKANGPSRVFCDNKGIVLAACGVNILIKKRSTALAFHRTREAIASSVVKLQHISGDKNWSDFLTKAVNNQKFMDCARALMVSCSKVTNL